MRAGPPGIHKPSKGGEHIPPTPLEGRLVSPISFCAIMQLMSGKRIFLISSHLFAS